MEAIEFITNYPAFLNEIENVVKPELLPIISEFRGIDPHDLVTPETFFISESHARGYVWSLILQRTRSTL